MIPLCRGAFGALLALAIPSAVHASCDVIPSANTVFAGALGASNRPFASPNDDIEIALRPCDATTPGLTTAAGFTASPDAYDVRVIFTPPNGGKRHTVLLTGAPTCDGAAIPDCASVNGSDPDACCVPRLVSGLTLVPRKNGTNLSFKLPNTDALIGTASDDVTLAGPATIIVTAAGAALPVGAADCADTTGMLACLGPFYAADGTCDTTEPASTFPHFTALPVPNNYQAFCETPDTPCLGDTAEIRFAVDAAGNVLMPMDWKGVQVKEDTVPVPRLIRASTIAEAFAGTGQPIRIPDVATLGLASDQSFLASYSLKGAKLEPIFDPQRDPSATGDITLFGSADAPATVLRIGRRTPTRLVCIHGPAAGQSCAKGESCPQGTCGVRTCVGGGNAGSECVDDGDCPVGTCRDGIFDFSDRVLDGVGPVVLRDRACLGGDNTLGMCSADSECPGGQCGDVRADALDPVPLEGLIQTNAANLFVKKEAILDRDLNNDGDMADDVVVISDRTTGVDQTLGVTTRIPEGPFRVPPVAAGGDLATFVTADGGAVDVFRLNQAQPVAEIPTPADLVANIDGRTIAVSNDRVFFRVVELATLPAAVSHITWPSPNPPGFLTVGSDARNRPALSANGRFLAFMGADHTVAPFKTDVFFYDRKTGTKELVSADPNGAVGDATSHSPRVSPDGRYVCFHSDATNLIAGDPGPGEFMRDRDTQKTSRYDGVSGPCFRIPPQFRSNGRFQTIETSQALTAGDFNGHPDIYLQDAKFGTFERVSSATGPFTIPDYAFYASDPAMSASGRYVGYNVLFDVYVRDRLRGATSFVSPGPAPFGNLNSVLSADGHTVAFVSDAGFPGGFNAYNQFQFEVFTTYVAGSDESGATDLFPNGELGDSILEVLDASAAPALHMLCPADAVSVADGKAAFLRPESAVGTSKCPGDSLNADDDVDDLVVQLWRGGDVVENLGRAAVAVAMSPTWIAALVSEADDVETKYNADDDTDDTVVQVHPVGDGDWTNVGRAADVLQVSGSIVVFETPESAEANVSLNGDGDTDDRVLQIYDAATGEILLGPETTPRSPAAEDFVIGGYPGHEIVAFRTREAKENVHLNDDDDLDDDVLQVYDVANRRLINTRTAVTPCRFEACDSRVPYAVGQHNVTFIMPECAQGSDLVEPRCPGGKGTDLNGNNVGSDLLRRDYNVRQASFSAALLLADPSGPRAARARADLTNAGHVLGALSSGLCTTNGTACISDSDCLGGSCFLPPGGCLRNLGMACDPNAPPSIPACNGAGFCEPVAGSPGQGVCKSVEGPCVSDASCNAIALCAVANPACVCNAAGAELPRLVNPLSTPNQRGAVFTSSGRCLEQLGVLCLSDADCGETAICGADHRCVRQLTTTCETLADCPAGATKCSPELVVATDPDTDGDEVLDRFDNCPRVVNPEQADEDGDGIGDACDPTTVCGNGRRDPGERCDDGNRLDGDGCSSTCELGCTPSPLSGCRRPAVARKSLLTLRARSGKHHDDLLRWEWRRGSKTIKADFGDPLRDDSYALCVYDAAGLVATTLAPPAGRCGTRSCWQAGSAGFRYQDRTRTPDGVTQIELKQGGDGRASIRVRGSGTQLGLPDQLRPVSPLQVQLQNSHGVCWEATYAAPFVKSGPSSVRARSD